MSRLFASGDIVDWVLGFMLVELIVLIIVRKQTGRGLQPLDLFVSVGAGAALLMVLRAAILGDAWPYLACWLLLSLSFHIWDLQRRWTTRRTP